jgi:hypothetical protein
VGAPAFAPASDADTPGSDAPIPSAVIGGTARYAGASGSLVERPLGAGARGHDLVEFVITFAS